MDERIKQQLKENQLHGTSIFPCAYYQMSGEGTRLLTEYHWHEEIEILYLSSGRFSVDINMQRYDCKDECFLFVNREEFHSICSVSAKFLQQVIVFHPQMLIFQAFDSIDEHVLKPMEKGTLTFPRFVSKEHPVFESLRAEFLQMVRVFEKESSINSTGKQVYTNNVISQMQIKASLLSITALLMESGLMESNKESESQKIACLKSALTYISSHYSEKIFVRDLALLANMNEQYFCRFFKSAIGKSPIAYINDYRLTRAIALLENQEDSVTEIAMQCGFHNMGNFQRLFREKTGTTPLRYRKMYLEEKSK